MVRLPQPGGDAGNWGAILNDFLLESHDTLGQLKSDTVGASQLKPLSVTNAAIANGTIASTKLAATNTANGVLVLGSDGRIPDASVPERLEAAALGVTPVTTRSTTSVSLAASDSSELIRLTGATLVTVSLPVNSATALPIGFWATLFAEGNEGFTINASAVTVVGSAPYLSVAQNGAMTVIKVGTNEWALFGGTHS